MTATSAASNWRDLLLQSIEQVSLAMDEARAEARALGSRAAAEKLNQALRRLRQSSQADLTSTLLDVCAPFSGRAAVITLEGTRARASLIRGFGPVEVEFDVSTAPAVLSVIETKDPVVAAVSATELSPQLFHAASRDLETSGRCHLFPLVTAGSVRIVLLALVDVEPAPIELLTEAAALRLELLEAGNRGVPEPGRGWTELPPKDQAAHLKAQRFARVAVAEMRVEHTTAVREGQERGALYKTLRPEIDAARETFRREFLSTTPGMVDYLYIELVRSLTNDNDRLLGPDFPGRLI